MSKFNHKFKLEDRSCSYRHYTEHCNERNTDIYVHFLSQNILRVCIAKEEAEILPTYNINPGNEVTDAGRDRLSAEGFKMFSPETKSDGECETFKMDGDIEVKIFCGNFHIEYYRKGNLLFSDRHPLAYNFDYEFGHGQYHYITREEDEKIYGLGDKGGAFNKAGRAFRIETADSMGYDAEKTDILYKHIPFYICENSKGSYGIFYDTTNSAYIDLGNEINNYYEPYKYFKSDDKALVYYVFFGSKYEIAKTFASVCGRQAFPPKWSFNYCASTMAYTDLPNSEDKMYEFLDALKSYDISCSAFYLSSGYTSIGDERCVFNWNREKFPDPEKFIADFNKNGIKVIPNIKPAFLKSHPLYEKIEENEYFIKSTEGTPFVTQFWGGVGSYLDFTNPSARVFWKNKVTETLLNFGIEATWNDNNEFDIKDWTALAYASWKSGAYEMRPALSYLMVLSSYEAQREKHPDKRPFLSTRSGGAGLRRLAQTWTGDNRTSFNDLRYCHNIGLTLSVSGFSFYGNDIGGFAGEMPSEELFLRWIQHGIFEPRFTIHSWNEDGSATMPWSYPDILKNVRELFAERKKLLPLLYSHAYDSVMSDNMITAPLCFCFDDENIWTESDAFVFCNDLLVYFIFDKGVTEKAVYLPKDNDWYLDGKLHSGGETVNITIKPGDIMPYFVREGSVIPTDEGKYGFSGTNKLVFTVYPVRSGEFKSEYFDDDGETYDYEKGICTRLSFDVVCTSDSVRVKYENTGQNILKPDICLCRGDKRKLIIEY